jgi:hypothetical protein
MTRRAFPYTPFDPGIQETGIVNERTHLPMDAPTLEYRNHYRYGTRIGEKDYTHGNLALVVPIEPIFTSGPETARGASRNVTGGVVRGYMRENTIRIRALVSRNLKSPTSHPSNAASAAYTAKIPPVNAVPSKDRAMPVKMGKRGTGGNFTIPNPQVIPSWPTSAEWIKSRFK